eukprot:11170799-Lingulodinium_polyedra.AAC.1
MVADRARVLLPDSWPPGAARVVPVLRVLAVGWVHALYWRQRVRETVIHRALSDHYTLRDDRLVSSFEHGAVSATSTTAECSP